MSKSWNRMIDPDDPWLRHDDISGKSPMTVEITGHGYWKSFDGKKEVEKFGISMKGGDAKLGLNKTNGYIIRTVLDEVEPDDWIGSKIILRTAELNKDNEQCIRVHLPKGSKLAKKYPKWKYTDEMEEK